MMHRYGGPENDRSVPNAPRPVRRGERGIALAIVLVMVVLLVTAVYAFSRRAVINATIAQNRLAAAEAESLARGGARMGEAIVYLARLQEQAAKGAPATGVASSAAALANPGSDLWAALGDSPVELEPGKVVRVSITEASGKLNLNALVAQLPKTGPDDGDPSASSGPATTSADAEEALEYLVLVLRHIVDGIDAPAEDTHYDVRSIAENLLDYMDADETSLNGRSENSFYRAQDPPYQARNGPFLSFDEIGLVEGVDPLLLEAMGNYLTIHPIGGTSGIDLNRAEPWVLPLVYAGTSGDRELISERVVRRILRLRQEGKKLCTDTAKDPDRCVSLTEAGIDEGSIFPETELPVPISVFRVVSEAQVANLTRRIEAIYDTRPSAGPQLLSWRRLRGTE